jgi:Putative N-acetylmannosamine-6-phosphate epimerase
VEFIRAFAQAAVLGGAQAVRLCGVETIRAVRPYVDVPIIGLTKDRYPDGRVLITAGVAEAQALVAAGADVVAVDATLRLRPLGLTGTEMVRQLRQVLGEVPLVADVDTWEAGVQAAAAGADYVATTLSGYTPATANHDLDSPDVNLVRQLSAVLNVPVWQKVAFARLPKPDKPGSRSYGVVVGSAITRPVDITRWFVQAITN